MKTFCRDLTCIIDREGNEINMEGEDQKRDDCFMHSCKSSRIWEHVQEQLILLGLTMLPFSICLLTNISTFLFIKPGISQCTTCEKIGSTWAPSVQKDFRVQQDFANSYLILLQCINKLVGNYFQRIISASGRKDSSCISILWL